MQFPQMIWLVVTALLAVSSVVASSNFTSIRPKRYDSKCVTASAFSNGTRLTLSDCDPRNQFQNIDPKIHPGKLSMANGTMCLDVAHGVRQDKTPVQLWPCINGNKNQMWETSAANPTGYSNFVWKGQNMCMFTDADPGVNGNITINACLPSALNEAWNATTTIYD